MSTSPLDDLPDAIRDQLRKAASDLYREHSAAVTQESIDTFVATSYLQLEETAKVTSFLPLMAARLARQRLEAYLSTMQPTDGVPTVLFLCVQNAGRSQMALGWLHALGGERVTGWSGGSVPADALHPESVRAMAEVGIDIASEVPKPWSTDIVGAADVVVTMGCGEDCPYYPSVRYEDWSVEDPHEASPEAVRRIRDELAVRVRDLLVELGVPVTETN